MNEPEAALNPETSRRRRKRDRSVRKLTRFEELVRRTSFWVALGCGALFGVLSIKQYSENFSAYGDYGLGQTRYDTLYGFGPPAWVANDQNRVWQPAPKTQEALQPFSDWRYDLPGETRVIIHFDQRGEADMLHCSTRSAVSTNCPVAFGVAVGDREEDVIAKLGNPTRIGFTGPVKRLSYPELGLEVGLEQFRTNSLKLNGSGSTLGLLGRYIRWALP